MQTVIHEERACVLLKRDGSTDVLSKLAKVLDVRIEDLVEG